MNRAYWPALIDRSRYLVLYGGAGAGKSYFAAQKCLDYVLRFRERKILVIRKTFPALRRTAMEMLEGLLKRYGIPYKFNRQEHIVRTVNQNQIWFASIGTGGEDFHKIKSITDVDFIWIEEATELSEKEFDEIDRRLRGQELEEGYRQICLTLNPIDINHWIHRRFFVQDVGTKIRTTYKDNKYIDSEYKMMLENLKAQDEYLYKVYVLGEWGVLTGQVYQNYIVEDFLFRTKNGLEFDQIFGGVDYGWNNPSAFVLVGVLGQNLYVIDEIYERQMSDSEFAKQIKKKIDFWGVNPYIACEHEPARTFELARAGLKVIPAKKGDVKEGLMRVREFRIRIHPRCINFIREIQSYKWKEDRSGNILDEPVKFNDHLLDAMRYGVMTFLRLGKPTVGTYRPMSISEIM
ncbi:MAG: PBSX family phage terminase large subunit [Candidatus Kapaibacteriota bacterium]